MVSTSIRTYVFVISIAAVILVGGGAASSYPSAFTDTSGQNNISSEQTDVALTHSTSLYQTDDTDHITISVNDSSHGQDTATAQVSVSTEENTTTVPAWVTDRGLTEEQFHAFDSNGNGELTGNEIRAGVRQYINNLPTGTVNDVKFTGNQIRSFVTGYINNLGA